MSRYTLKMLITAIVLLLPCLVFALPGPHDPTSGRNYNCMSCHATGSTLGASGWDNVCLYCHNGGVDPLPAANGMRTKRFDKADFANPYRTYTSARPAILYQTSHKWTGTDTVPKAGALPPVDPYKTTSNGMNKPILVNGLTCARCHNIHGDSGLQSTASPYLRSPNDKDQMCLDCHRPRNTSSHTVGSHPVNVSYTSARVKNSAKFKKDALDSSIPPTNPANRSAEMKIKSGLVLCSTCHGVHYSDSNSRTFDSHSSAASNVIRPSGFGGLSTGKGHLLRTDLRGATSANLNICSNCHNKPNHNKRGQNIQCADCHSAHVDTVDGTIPNTYVVRRYMNVSTSKGAIRNKAAFYQYTGSRRNWKNADVAKPGVCQSCHIVPTGGAYPTEHNDASGSNGKLCMSCHAHDAADGAFSASCTTCHGYPPADSHGGGPTGYALDGSVSYALQAFYKDETVTPHTVHAGGAPYSFACNECHKGNSHNSGSTFQDVFKASDVTLASNGFGTTPSYAPNNNAGPGTCATYCHSNAKPAIGAYVTKAPQWANGKGTIIGTGGECTACHDNAAGFAGTAHVKHVSATVGKAYACATCHAATVDSTSAIIDKNKHVNAQKDVSFSGSIGSNPLAGTCTTVYCHSNGKGAAAEVAPSFATLSTGQCGACHKASPGLASGRPLIDSAAHYAHMSSSYGPKSYLQSGAAATSCAKCHTYTNELAATHVNGAVEVISGAGSTCKTCHPNGVLPVWSGGRVTCESCHSGTPSVINSLTAPTKPNFTATGHGQAPGNYNASRQCNACHDPDSPHISNALNTYKRIAVNDNTLCFGCHNNAGKVPAAAKQGVATHVVAKNGVAVMDCKLCHDAHGTANSNMIKSFITFGSLTSTISYGSSNDLVQLTPPYRGVCQTCHTLTSHYRRNANEGANHPTSGCLNCHTHKDAYAFKPRACDACHGYPPAPKGFVPAQGNFSSAKLENYSGGGGAHVKAGHILANVKPSQGFSPCVACHNDGGSGHIGRAAIFHPMTSPTTLQKKAKTSVRVDVNYKFNATKSLDATQYRKAAPDNTGSCWNVSCHFQPTPRWSNDK